MAQNPKNKKKKPNGPQRPGSQPQTAAPNRGGGGGGGGNNNRDRDRNRNRHRDGGGGGTNPPPGDDPNDGQTPGTTTDFAVQDPAAWIRNAMTSSGFTPNAATNYGRFQQEAIVSPFVAGWDQWKATHAADIENNFWDYAQSTGMGLPAAYTGGVGPPSLAAGRDPAVMSLDQFRQAGGAPLATPKLAPAASSNNAFAPPTAAEMGAAASAKPVVMDFATFEQSGGAPGQALIASMSKKKNSPKKPPKDEPPAAAPPNPATLNWDQFRAWQQNEIDKYSPQQQGRFDPAKRPGSIRYNQFG